MTNKLVSHTKQISIKYETRGSVKYTLVKLSKNYFSKKVSNNDKLEKDVLSNM